LGKEKRGKAPLVPTLSPLLLLLLKSLSLPEKMALLTSKES